MSNQKQFIEFVMEQDDDMPIDHDSWNRCAVGNFLNSIESEESAYVFANHDLDHRLMQALGGDNNPIVGDTYGEFKVFLDENGYLA